ncbi:MAG: TIGR03032 family protein [Planctomycetales bacterium]|nr:TIGR03032 family protein [Planctomycetales bacterium]
MDDPSFRYVHSDSFPQLLRDTSATLLITTYQAGKLIAVRALDAKLSIPMRTFERAMGLAVDHRQLILGTRREIWHFRNAPDIGRQLDSPVAHDACFVPRVAQITGNIDVHELTLVQGEIWFVNTRFSCLGVLDPDYSFVPRWWPDFVTEIAPEDRCHLSGMAVANGVPHYVTALGETNEPEAWRRHKAHGGIVIDVSSGEIVLRQLSMPHSPRLYRGHLWLLNSGEGTLIKADPASGRHETICRLPGYPRGLAIHGDYAFIGLSRLRESGTLSGLPIAERRMKLICGVHVVNLSTGMPVATLEFDSGVDEIFDVQLLVGITFPAIIGRQKDTLDGIFLVPPGPRRWH